MRGCGSHDRLWIVLVAILVAAGGAAADEGSPVQWAYRDGLHVATTDGRFVLDLNAGIQLRYTYVDYDESIVGNESDYSNFYIRRARIYLRGNAFDPRFTYFIHLQLEPTRTVNAHDLWLEYEVSDLVRIGAGRNKIAYGLEFLNSGFGLAFVERSVFSGETDVDLNPGGPVYPGGGTARFGLSSEASTGYSTGGLTPYRSQGVQVQGRRGGGTSPTFEYQVGLWQGRGTTGLSNPDDRHLVSARVGYYPWGFIDWRFQGDGDHTPRLKLGLVASGYQNSGAVGPSFDETAANLALLARYRGMALDAEWGMERYTLGDRPDDFDREGFRCQLGAFVLGQTLEVVGRYAQIERLRRPTFDRAMASGLGVAERHVADGTELAVEERISEITVGLNWYLHRWHRHKLQLDLSRLERSFAADPSAEVDGLPHPIPRGPDQVDHRVRTLVQLSF